MRTEKKEVPAESDKDGGKEDNKVFQLPGWVKDVAVKMLPWVIMSIIGANVSLYIDNINTKKDVARETWRNDQQDARQSRFEANQDKIRERFEESQDDQEAFKGMLVDRLDTLIEKQGRRERARER